MLLKLAQRIMKRPPDFVIGGTERPYMHRWYILPRNRWLNIYLHRIMRSDDDRALHDHPWANCSIVLDGGYYELTPDDWRTYSYGDSVAWRWRGPGSIVFRPARKMHRLVLEGVLAGKALVPCISLFLTGRNVREWGFVSSRGWVHWQKFTDPTDPGVYRESDG